ncbi:MAG TPA: ABC transporter permease [Candidatus Anoxymicrobiaceae bacterium]
MSISELFRTALHSLRINPVRSMLAILGVVFGVGAVVVLISMGAGVKTQISDQIRDMGTDLVIVKSGKEVAPEDRGVNAQVANSVSGSNLTAKDAKVVADDKEFVEGATGTIEQAEQVVSPKAMYVKIVGGDLDFRKVRDLAYSRQAKGWTFENKKRGECVIGQAVKTTVFGEHKRDSDVIGEKIKIQNNEFVIKAVAAPKEKSLFADPNRQVFIGIEDAREVFGAKDSDKVLEVYAKVKNASRVKEAKTQITAELKKTHDDSHPFYVATQDDLVASYNKIFSILTALVLGVALVALAESAIGVSNIMYIAVKERTREIGVRLAQGASFRAILAQFLFESVTLCLVGSAIGIPLGVFIAFLINKYTVLPAQTPLWAVLVAFLAGMIVGVVAGVYPAWKATQSDIAEVLRAE